MMFDTQCEQAALRFLDELIKAAPFQIYRIKTDNGSEFTNKYLKNHDTHETLFEMRLLAEGIKYYRIQPESRGKTARWNLSTVWIRNGSTTACKWKAWRTVGDSLPCMMSSRANFRSGV